MKRWLLAVLVLTILALPAEAMLAKYWRLHMLWEADQTLSFLAGDGASIAVRCAPWKLDGGDLSYGTTITDDLGFDGTDTIVDDGSVEGSINDNTTNLYWGIKGYFQITADVTSTDGAAYLFVEESDDNTNWPSDQADFEIDQDLRLVCVLSMSTTDVNQPRAKNFEF